MDPFEHVDTETVLSGDPDQYSPALAELLAKHPLDCVETAYPHLAWSVDGPDETVDPEADHPVFYGCFDWHSAVHSHWNLVRQLRLIDDHPEETAITAGIDRRFSEANVEQEVQALEADRSFEKPYGWAWFLRLAAELHLWDDERAREWHTMLEPLETLIVDLVETELLPDERPFRVGTHRNTAFALASVLDFARVTSTDSLETATMETARRFYLDDRDAPVEYEPFGWDFLSPTLTELDLMRRVLDADAFARWSEQFLPDLSQAPYSDILQPVAVDPDAAAGHELHYVGLNIAKAWCLAGTASVFDGQPNEAVFETAVRRHVEASLEAAFTSEYAGSHWLSSFVVYLLTRNAGAIAP